MTCPTGNGATIVFGDTAWIGRINVINGLEEEVDVIEDDDLKTGDGVDPAVPVYMPYCKGDLVRLSPLEVEIFFEPGNPPPIAQPQETITILYPSGHQLSGTGFNNSRTGGTYQNNERVMGSFSIQFDGKTGPTYSATP